MAYCPECRSEYEDDVKICTDCGAALVAGAVPDDTTTHSLDAPLSLVMRVNSAQNAQIIRGLLESASIPCEITEEPFISMVPLPDVVSPARYTISVPEDLLGEARRVLSEAREASVPCPSCGHLSAAEATACEYCGAALL